MILNLQRPFQGVSQATIEIEKTHPAIMTVLSSRETKPCMSFKCCGGKMSFTAFLWKNFLWSHLNFSVTFKYSLNWGQASGKTRKFQSLDSIIGKTMGFGKARKYCFDKVDPPPLPYLWMLLQGMVKCC